MRLLNYIPYNRADAVAEVERTVGWRSYGRKPGESLFTKFFQNYYLSIKFGYDKRRPAPSSMIVSGQLSREASMKLVEEPLYYPEELEIDRHYFCKKIGIENHELTRIMA